MAPEISTAYTPYAALFASLPGHSILLQNDAQFTIIAATPQYLAQTHTKAEELIGKGLFEIFPAHTQSPDYNGEKGMRDSFAYVLAHQEAQYLPVQRYDLTDTNGVRTERYWKICNSPVILPTGEVGYIIHTAEDVTEGVVRQRQLESLQDLERVNNLFQQAPVAIQIFKGPDLIIELANDLTLQMWDRDKDAIGKAFLDVLPELRGQGYEKLMQEVMDSGKTMTFYERPIVLFRKGALTTGYFNFLYQPYYEPGLAQSVGVLVFTTEVTEQVTSRLQATESDTKYRVLFETMDQGFCVLEMIFDESGKPVDYRFLETNPVFEKHTGLKDATGKTIREMVPDLETHWFELYGNVALTGQSAHFTEGSQVMGRWFDVYAFRIGSTGSYKVALLFTDITERKRLEDVVKRSESNFRNMVMQSPVAMCIVTGPSFIVDVANEKILEIWGKSAEEMLGKPVFESLPEAGAQGLESIMQNVYNTGERYTANELPVSLPRNGKLELVYINFVYEPFYDANNHVTGIMAVAIDVTEQVVARMQVEESNKEFSFVTDFMPQMIWLTRPDGYHYYYNKQWYDYTGMAYTDTQGEGWNEVFHPDDQEKAWALWNDSLATGEPYEIEYRCRRYDGEYRWFLGRALPLKDDNGAILKWFGTCTDIHDQKTAADVMEQKVEERTHELKQVNDQLKQFAYSASHDLQEPLRKIGFFVDRLVTSLGDSLSEDNKLITQRIVHTAGRMRILIDDLLAYSNTTLGATGFEAVDLNEVMQNVVEDMEGTIIAKEAVVNMKNLPTVQGDHRQLRQLFQNLISNALKYQKKDEAPWVEISSRMVDGNNLEADVPHNFKEHTYYQIAVKDNGIGFDPDDAERIFRLFQRLHGKAEYEGTGVGLAIVQKVVENHNGYIWAEAAPGAGATFYVLLPAE